MSYIKWQLLYSNLSIRISRWPSYLQFAWVRKNQYTHPSEVGGKLNLNNFTRVIKKEIYIVKFFIGKKVREEDEKKKPQR